MLACLTIIAMILPISATTAVAADVSYPGESSGVEYLYLADGSIYKYTQGQQPELVFESDGRVDGQCELYDGKCQTRFDAYAPDGKGAVYAVTTSRAANAAISDTSSIKIVKISKDDSGWTAVSAVDNIGADIIGGAFGSDGAYYFGGTTKGTNSSQYLKLFRYDPATGQTLYLGYFNTPGINQATRGQFLFDSNGNLLLNTTTSNYRTYQYNFAGYSITASTLSSLVSAAQSTPTQTYKAAAKGFGVAGYWNTNLIPKNTSAISVQSTFNVTTAMKDAGSTPTGGVLQLSNGNLAVAINNVGSDTAISEIDKTAHITIEELSPTGQVVQSVPVVKAQLNDNEVQEFNFSPPFTPPTPVSAPSTIKLTKTIASRYNSSDQFNVTLTSNTKDANGTLASSTVTTKGTETSVSTQTLDYDAGDTAITLTEGLTSNADMRKTYQTPVVQCVAEDNTTWNPTVSDGMYNTSSNTWNIPVTLDSTRKDTVCTITNTAQEHPSTVQLKKMVASRYNASDQFAITLTSDTTDANGNANTASVETTGNATTAQTAAVDYTAGTITLSEGLTNGTDMRTTYQTPIVSCVAANNSSWAPTVSDSMYDTSSNTWNIPVTMTADYKDTVCTITNTAKPHVGVSIYKFDAATGTGLAGATFTIKPQNGSDSQAQTVVTNSNGNATWSNLDRNTTYVIQETKAPAGYVAPTRTWTVDPSSWSYSNTTAFNIANTRANATLTFEKRSSLTDLNSGTLLAGSQWKLTTPSGQSLTITDCTSGSCTNSLDKDPTPGVFKVTLDGNNAPYGWGKYTLTETKAPTGFLLSSKTIEFTFDATHNTFNYTGAQSILNRPASVPELPLTGGTSESAFVYSGLSLMILAATLLIVRRIRKNNN